MAKQDMNSTIQQKVGETDQQYQTRLWTDIVDAYCAALIITKELERSKDIEVILGIYDTPYLEDRLRYMASLSVGVSITD